MIGKEQGRYTDFLMKVVDQLKNFDTFFSEVGGYAEPEELMAVTPMSASIRHHTPDYSSDWRFFGRYLSWRDDARIISDMNLLVEEMVRVFDLIEKYRY